MHIPNCYWHAMPTVQYQALFLLISTDKYNVQWQQYVTKTWDILNWPTKAASVWEGKWILSFKYLICRICPQRWTITVEAWEGPKAWWTNEENGVCVGYFVSVTPGVTLQSIQCQSNCEDKTGRANQCSGSQTARSHERAPLFAHEKLQPCLWTWTQGDQSLMSLAVVSKSDRAF